MGSIRVQGTRKDYEEEAAEYLRLSYTAGSRIHHYNYFVKPLAVSVKAKHMPNLYDATIPLIQKLINIKLYKCIYLPIDIQEIYMNRSVKGHVKECS